MPYVPAVSSPSQCVICLSVTVHDDIMKYKSALNTPFSFELRGAEVLVDAARVRALQPQFEAIFRSFCILLLLLFQVYEKSFSPSHTHWYIRLSFPSLTPPTLTNPTPLTPDPYHSAQ